MTINFCTVSSETWVVISALAIAWGFIVSCILQAIFTKSGLHLSASIGQNFVGGCLAPVVIAGLSGFGVSRWIPDDPCGGFTPDAIFIPPFLGLLVTISALTLFWVKAWRR